MLTSRDGQKEPQPENHEINPERRSFGFSNHLNVLKFHFSRIGRKKTDLRVFRTHPIAGFVLARTTLKHLESRCAREDLSQHCSRVKIEDSRQSATTREKMSGRNYQEKPNFCCWIVGCLFHVQHELHSGTAFRKLGPFVDPRGPGSNSSGTRASALVRP